MSQESFGSSEDRNKLAEESCERLEGLLAQAESDDELIDLNKGDSIYFSKSDEQLVGKIHLLAEDLRQEVKTLKKLRKSLNDEYANQTEALLIRADIYLADHDRKTEARIKQIKFVAPLRKGSSIEAKAQMEEEGQPRPLNEREKLELKRVLGHISREEYQDQISELSKEKSS